MNRNNNILLKTFLLLMLAVGWGGVSSAMTTITSSPAPTGGKFADNTQWYTIVYRGQNNAGTYFNVDQNTNGELQWGSTSLDEGAYWCFVGDNTSGYKMYNLKTGVSMVLAALGTSSNAHVKMVDATSASAMSDLALFTTGAMTASGKTNFNYIRRGLTGQSGFNNNGTYVAMYTHPSNLTTGGNFAVEIQPATPPKMANATLRFIDNKGADLPTGSVLFTGTGGEPVTINASEGTHDFGNLTYSSSYFAATNDLYTLSTSFAEGVLTFTLTADPNKLQFSDAPSSTGWNANTHWFTMRNNRENIDANWQFKYLTTTANGTRDDLSLYIRDLGRDVPPSDRGGYWCFVGDNTNGFHIQNMAYGPDFYLAYLGNNKYTMVHKDQIPSGAVVLFTYNDQSNFKGGGSKGYIFRIGTSDYNHIHINNSDMIAWNPGSWKLDDSGSSFRLNLASEGDYSSMPQLDVYKVTLGGGIVSYTGTRTVFGKRNISPYIILENGGAEVTLSDISVTGFSLASVNVAQPSTSTYMKTITANVSIPLTQPNWYYIKVRNGGYMSTADGYVNANGDMMLNNATLPNDYQGLWMEIPSSEMDANGQGVMYFVNAYTGDTKVLAVTGSDGNASGKMYSLEDLPNNANVFFDRKYRSDRPDAFFFKSAGSDNNYLNKNNNKFAYWNHGNAYNNPDDGSTFDHVAVPNLPNNTQIVFEAASSDIDLAGLKIVYSNLEFIRKDGSSTTTTVASTSELTNGQNYNFGNVPGLTSLFSVYNHPELRIARIEVEGTSVKLIIDRLPKIIHRQHAVFNHLAEVDAEHKPNSKFIQDGQGLVNHPYAANFTGAGYTDNDRTMQNTSVFHITQYTKPGTRTECVLPFTRNKSTTQQHVSQYQRWYNYETERYLDANVIDGNIGRFNIYLNGFCNFAVEGNNVSRQLDVLGKADLMLPIGKKEIYVGVDASEFQDYGAETATGNFIEPSLNERVVFHIISAHEMAKELTTSGNKWWEEKTYYVPNIKRGKNDYRNNADLIPFDMPFSNYWIYKTGSKTDADLMPIVAENGSYDNLRSNLEIVVEGTAKDYIQVGVFDGNPGNIGSAPYINSNHFLYYKINGDESTRVVPTGSQAVIKVYAKNGTSGTTKYQLAKFTLNFQADTEPLAITSVINNPASTRSVEYFNSQQMAQVASLTFQEKDVAFKRIPSHRNDGNEGRTYAFPIDFARTSYGYSPSFTFGNYSVTRNGYGIKYQPVSLYERNIKEGTNDMSIQDDYFFYIDAAETPGQVASVTLEGSLCPGSRLYCYGWVGSGNFYNSTGLAASVVLELVGRRSDGTEKILASYLPGTLTDVAYDSDDTEIRSLNYGRERSMNQAGFQSPNTTQLGVWQSVGFSFLLNETGFASYEMRIINNCFTTSGGDYSLDDFRVFMNPPKGSVDFTTPLCSDKVRHAKIHADYDMIKTTSGKNETEASDDPNYYVTCCFLEASVFDSYEKDGLKISEIFDIDSKGNHFLKPEYADTEEKLEKSEALINEAFGVALVGTRSLSDADSEAHGFHVYTIKPVYTDIDPYVYNDSKSDAVYRETGSDGVKRIVFKEDVVRGDMEMLPDGRYPHMRPSTEYYLVFSTIKATQSMIDHHSTATDIFHIHEQCSFFGKFTTKDPMHVILDNADIEADIPVRAVCHGEETTFSFDMPAMKLNKPIFDEAYCTSDEDLHQQMVPSTHGANHYKYEPKLNEPEVIAVIRDLPYDWWFGGTLKGSWGEKKYRGTIDEYKSATHPSITYSGPKDIAHKQDNAPVNIAQAMTDFRFYYPEFGKGISDWKNLDWSGVTRKEYNNETGYGLLDSEIATIRDFVEAGIITLYRDSYEKPMTYDEADQLIEKELSDMMESEMNAQILNLALKLDDDPAIAANLPLKKLEATVLDKLSPEGRKSLTIEELGNLTHDNLKAVAEKLRSSGKLKLSSEKINSMSQNLLFNFVEPVLKAMDEGELRTFAQTYFPDLGHVKRAYLVVRALDIMSRETVAALTPEEQQTSATVRTKLRAKMIEVFSEQSADVLKKMIHDGTAKLSMDEREALLKDKDLDNMSQAELAVVVEDGLAIITDNSLRDLKSDRYLHFTLIPIMPSQENFVDEPYIFCPEPRGVRIRLTTHEPVMLDGFADMSYPEDMKNVPVRLGLPQINKTKAGQNKTLRIPVRGMKKAAQDGIVAVKLTDTGYQNYLFLAKTDDPQYMQSGASADTDGLTEAKNLEGVYAKMVGTVEKMVAVYPTDEDKTPINYIDVLFASDMKFREGYTYRVGVNFMEKNADDQPTISCYGTMLFDMKIVPEYQKWTAAEGTAEWTNDGNWVRADRNKLNADNTATGDVIDGSTDITSSDNYPTNAVNTTSKSFVPMYFTNVLIDKDADAPVLYEGLTAASRSQKKFLAGLKSTATERIIYDMEVYPSTGAWHAEGNHECGLFGTYVANGITFLPATQLFNAHLLDYKKAWVEYELTSNRWYTLASPLQNTFAGEWYAPTAGARQQTPHFYGINYSHDLNHRFQPAIYQRSWDSKGNNPVYLKQGGVQEAYIKADWSYVYNDVTKEYSQGGFSVKVSDELMESVPVSGKSLIRMPKADTKYTYYDLNNQTGAKPDDVLNVNNNRYHLWSDKLKEAESFTQTITNVTSDNNFFLVGNPFMAKMDMDQFFAVNDHLEKKFWIMTEDGQEVSVKVDGENGKWIATNGTIGKVAPLQGFFVKGSGNTTTLTFTADMQAPDDALASGDTSVLRAKTTRSSAQQGNEVIRLIAERDGAKSTALIVLGDNADDSYVATEDCEVFIDGNVYDLPTVYTSSASVAQTINVRSSLEMVPVGIISSDDSETVLRFDLSESSSESVYLYDSLTNQFEKISDGAEVLMSGNNSGRYFLSEATTGINNLTVDRDTVRKGVYTLSGKYCGTKVQGLAPGIYVVDGVKMHVK